jgi:hypothetical protein
MEGLRIKGTFQGFISSQDFRACTYNRLPGKGYKRNHDHSGMAAALERYQGRLAYLLLKENGFFLFSKAGTGTGVGRQLV